MDTAGRCPSGKSLPPRKVGRWNGKMQEKPGCVGRHSPPTDDIPLNVALDAQGTHMLCLFGS